MYQQKSSSWIVQNYLVIIAATIIIIGMAGGIFFIYRWYNDYQMRAAQKVFARYLQEYKHATKQAPPAWERIADRLGVACQELDATPFGAYCLLYQSQALVELHKNDEAIDLLTRAIQTINQTSPLFFATKIKRALMMMDASAEQTREQGVAELIDLARNTDNPQRDISLYYVGQYYWSHDRLDDAKKVWQELLDVYRHEKSAPSAWVTLVEERLQQIP